MGYMNYYLKDKDIIERRKQNFTELLNYKTNVNRPKKICPYCQTMFKNNKSLYEHVKKKHYISECTLIINGKIINDKEISYVMDMSTVHIILYDNKTVISIDGDRYIYENDIEDLLIKKFAQNKQIKITIGNKQYIIKSYSTELIDMNKIGKYIKEWNSATVLNKPISNIYDNSLNDFEIKYLNGLYNYFIATAAKNFEKGDRYIDAYGILNQFNPINAQGLMILKIISFRLNWIDILSTLCHERDEFKMISDFYQGVYSNIDKNIKGERKEIFIEDEILLNMHAFINFISGNKSEVDKYLNNIDMDTIEDVNYKDRLFLLKALRCVDKHRKYRFYVNEITKNKFVNIVENYKEL
jgi:hypothetical protein